MSNDHVVLTLWTNRPDIALKADAAGVDRIGIDLDRIGKSERQTGLGTWISSHTPADLNLLGPAVSRGQLFARTNPLHDDTPAEIELLLLAGAQVLMLPMFRYAAELARFVALVAGRARVVGLLETASALGDLDAVVRVTGLDELHVGINDLALALGLRNRFEVLVSPEIEQIARAAAATGIRLGVGGLGRTTDTELPIAPDLVYAQYPRLGATAALISRSFLGSDCELKLEIPRLRRRLAWWAARPQSELDRAREQLRDLAAGCERF